MQRPHEGLLGLALLAPPRPGLILAGFLGAAGLLVLGLGALQLVLDVFDPYHRKPRPDGMVLRIAIGQVESPLERVLVEPADGRAAFRIRGPAESLEVDYPSGAARELEDVTGAARELVLDLDGDGTADELRIGLGPDADLVEVVSGASGELLFADRDPFEYADRERAFPLGDLDGDGFGELALVHPRRERTYDFHPGDALFTPRSWVTVVSGSRLAR